MIVHHVPCSHAFKHLWVLGETCIFLQSTVSQTQTHTCSSSHLVLSPSPVAARLLHYLTTSPQTAWHIFEMLPFFSFLMLPWQSCTPAGVTWKRREGVCCKNSHCSTYLCFSCYLHCLQHRHASHYTESWIMVPLLLPTIQFYIAKESIITLITFNVSAVNT